MANKKITTADLAKITKATANYKSEAAKGQKGKGVQAAPMYTGNSRQQNGRIISAPTTAAKNTAVKDAPMYTDRYRKQLGIYDGDDYSDDDILTLTRNFTNTLKSGISPSTKNERVKKSGQILKKALDSYKSKNGALPKGYDDFYVSLSGLSESTPQVIRNATQNETDNFKKVTSVPLKNTGVKLNISGLNDVNKNAFYEKFGNKSISQLSPSDVGSLVVNNLIDLEDVKKRDVNVYNALLDKYKRYTASDGVGLSHRVRLGFENTARSAAESLEATGRGVVNAGATLADALISDKAKSQKIDNFIKRNQVNSDIADKYEFMPRGLKAVTDVVGSSAQLAPVIALGSINPALGMSLIGTSAFGNSYSSARRDGADKNKALAYAAFNAAAEILVEKLAGGVPGLGKGAMTKTTNKLIYSFKNPTVQKLLRVGLEACGEGMEEVYTYLFEPWFKKWTYDKDAKIDYAAEEIGLNFLGGFAGSAIFGGGAVILGFDADPAAAEYAEATQAVKKYAKSAFHKGIGHADTLKLLKKAERLVKNASYYDSENNVYRVPASLSEIFNAGKVVSEVPQSPQAAEIIKEYAGVGNTQVVKNDVYSKLIADKKISRREAAAMDTLAYYFGVNIEFVDNLTDGDGTILNGEYSADGRTIKINANSADPLFTTVLHESVHALKRGNAQMFATLSSELKNLVGSNTSEFSKAFKAVHRSYRKQLTNDAAINKDIVDEEFTSFMLSYLLDNPKTLKSLARKNMNTVQKLADSILGWFDGSIERYKNIDTSHQGALSDAVAKLQSKRDMFAQMFEEGMEGYWRSADFVSEGKCAIAKTDKNRPVVVFDNDFLKGKKKDEWARTAYRYIKKYSPAIPVHGQLIKVTVDSRKEYAYSEYSKGLKSEDLTVYKDKLSFAGNLDEILWASVDFVNEKAKHDRTDDIIDFARGKVLLKIGKRKYTADVVVGITSNGSARFHDIVDLNLTDFKIKEAGTKSAHIGESYRLGRPTSKDSISQKRNFDNKNITENVGRNLGRMTQGEAPPAQSKISGVAYTSSTASGPPSPQGEGRVSGGVAERLGIRTRTERVLRAAGERYGLGNLSNEDVMNASLAQADIDARLGREFMFEDFTVQSGVRDKFNNSLHLSDSVVFEGGEGANVEYAAGRILGFDENGNVVIAADSGWHTDTAVVSASKVTFIAHNDETTVSLDFSSFNPSYQRAKNAFDNFGKTGDVSLLETFGFNEAQNFLFDTSEKVYALTRLLKKIEGYDHGIARHISNTHSEYDDSDPHRYTDMSAHDLLRQYYDAVRCANLASDIAGIYIESGAELVNFEEMVASLHDVDGLHFKTKKGDYHSTGTIAHGNYMFNDVYRNFERVFKNNFHVVKPYLDNLDRSKGQYARNLMRNGNFILGLCEKYNFKPRDSFDKAVQWYGEGSIHFDLRKAKDKKLFRELGYDEANYQYRDEVDVKFGDRELEDYLGAERAAQVKECAAEFRALYDDYLERVNQTIAQIYPGQTDRLVKPRKDYFRHFKEVSDDLFSLAFQMTEDIQIDPMLAGKTDRTKPKQSFESYRQERKTEQTDYSAVMGFVDYMQQAEYTININPHIKVFRELGQNLAYHKAQQGSSNLNSFLNYLDKFANHLAKKTTGFDRFFTDFAGSNGRKFLHALEIGNNRKMKNDILGNASVAIKQVLNLPNGIVYLQKPSLLINSCVGLGKALTSDPVLLEHYTQLMDQSNYLAERYLDLSFAQKKSGARKVAEQIASIGDEFACRALWLAAYEDAVRLNVPDPIIYADDITRKATAGRGIGEKPMAFTQQVTKMFLPFLLENNNKWNVWRDFFSNTVKSKAGENEFNDKNSYLYYRNQKSDLDKLSSRSFRLAVMLLITCGVGDLLEEITGYRPEFDPINDFRKGIRKALREKDGEFDFATLMNCLWESGKFMFADFAEHRNFTAPYAAFESLLTDDPLISENDIFGAVPTASLIGNIGSSLIDRDFVGAGVELATGFLMPYGGGQLKKSMKGVADVALGGKYNTPYTKLIQGGAGEPWGGMKYEVEQSPENYIRGALFGAGSLPEVREYWEQRELAGDEKKNAAKIEREAFEAYQTAFRKNKDAFNRALKRVQDVTGSDSAIPFEYVGKEFTYTDYKGEDITIELGDEERESLQSELIAALEAKFRKVYNTLAFTNADNDGKLKLLSKARSDVVSDFKKNLTAQKKYGGVIDEYAAAHGEDDVVKIFRSSGDYDILPVYETPRKKEYTLSGKKDSFELTDEQLDKYNALAGEEIEKEYAAVMNKSSWAYLSNTTKKERLLEAKKKAAERVSEWVKWDYVYADAIKEFDATYGSDNPVRKAYEYSHDATVYPYYVLDDTIEFTKDKKKWVYTISKEENSYGDRVEYDRLQEMTNDKFVYNYVNNVIVTGDLNGKSGREAYEVFSEYKKKGISWVKNELKKYVIWRAPSAPGQLEIGG